MIEWQHLGQLLGLPESDLEAINEENETTEDRRREMLLLWMERDPDCTWKKVVDALIEMKADALAEEISSRYGNYIVNGSQQCNWVHQYNYESHLLPV